MSLLDKFKDAKSISSSGYYVNSNKSVTNDVNAGKSTTNKIGRFTLDAVGAITKPLAWGSRAVKSAISAPGSLLAGVGAAIDPVSRKALGTKGAFKAGMQGGWQGTKDIYSSDLSGALKKSGVKMGTVAELATDILLDPTTYVGFGALTKPLGAINKATNIVAKGGKVTGSVLPKLAEGKGIINKIVGGAETLMQGKFAPGVRAIDTASETVPKALEEAGTIAKVTNKLAPQIQGISKAISKVPLIGSKQMDAVAFALGKSKTAALKASGKYEVYVDKVQRQVVSDGLELTDRNIKDKVYEILKSAGENRMTPDEFASHTSGYIDVENKITKVTKGLALKNLDNMPKGMELDYKAMEKAIKDKGFAEVLYGPKGRQTATKINADQFAELKRARDEAGKLGYGLIREPGKSAVYDKQNLGFKQEGYTRFGESGSKLQAPVQATSPGLLRKILTGQGNTERDLGALAQRKVFDNVANATDSSKARELMKKLDDEIKTLGEKAKNSKDLPGYREFTLGEGITPASRYLDIPNSTINKIGRDIGVDNAAKLVKSGYAVDWSLMGVQNIGTHLRARSGTVDAIARLKNFMRFDVNPMFHGNQWIEYGFLKQVMNPKNVSMPKEARDLLTQLDDVFAITEPQFIKKGYDLAAIRNISPRFMEEQLDLLTQGTMYKNGKGLLKEIEDAVRGGNKVIRDANGNVMQISKITSKRSWEDGIQALKEYSKEREINSLTQALLERHDEVQPALAILAEAQVRSEDLVRGIAQMSHIRGGLERSANYIFFPTSYVVRMTKALAKLSVQPGYGAGLRVVDRVKKDVSQYIKDTYGASAEFMPNTMWVVEQIIPLGLDNVGAAIDPFARWMMATLGVNASKPTDLKKSYVPVYRNYQELDRAMKEIRDVFTGKKSMIQNGKGIKVYASNEMYKDIFLNAPIKPKEFNMEKQLQNKLEKAGKFERDIRSSLYQPNPKKAKVKKIPRTKVNIVNKLQGPKIPSTLSK